MIASKYPMQQADLSQFWTLIARWYLPDESSNEDMDDEESSDGYSSPDIDYEDVANYEENNEQNSTESTKIHKDQQNVDSDKSDDLYKYDPGCDYE